MILQRIAKYPQILKVLNAYLKSRNISFKELFTKESISKQFIILNEFSILVFKTGIEITFYEYIIRDYTPFGDIEHKRISINNKDKANFEYYELAVEEMFNHIQTYHLTNIEIPY